MSGSGGGCIVDIIRENTLCKVSATCYTHNDVIDNNVRETSSVDPEASIEKDSDSSIKDKTPDRQLVVPQSSEASFNIVHNAVAAVNPVQERDPIIIIED